MKVGIYTLGCKVNTYESEYIASLFREAGYKIADFEDTCDVYVINTCTVTNQSDVKSRKMIHQVVRRNPSACIVAMGCFIEANKDISLEGVDIILGNKDKSKVVSLVEQFFATREPIRDLYDDLGDEFEDMEIRDFENRTRAFVKIQDGCENFCSYCIIPRVRGRCRSKKKDVVLREIECLIQHGFQEIVLTGIHTGNYGVDLGTDFASLLADIVELKGLKRLRISSIEITELNDRVLEILANYPVIVDHLHIPLQSGSDEILKRMNRKYDTIYYREKINKIRLVRPEIAITTDVIVGFPGEDETHFMETYQFCEEMNFAKIHVFPYSIRSKTAASKMKDQVLGPIKKERVKRLLSLSNQLEKSYMDQFVGRTVEVLIERERDGISYGHTGNYLFVQVEGKYQSGDLLPLKIFKTAYPCCIASPLTEKEVVKQ
ncbi:MAG TPA: tRNA (N(6)-L-threonylcarbamoyladenosine(37)-C(2))-methylthiotransferase MtaB [Candidatus Scybalousia intestinigallinarum]|nr:tRNA (N(6)-L-threonylcarbamoyladenosine(37)-C(2))-methylthiotransferase MtaB [Candidatus Scybalousia intestinigallinarum]